MSLTFLQILFLKIFLKEAFGSPSTKVAKFMKDVVKWSTEWGDCLPCPDACVRSSIVRQVDIIDWQDLVPSDYHLFGSMKKGLRGKYYASVKEAKTAVEFYKAAIHALIRKWDITIERNGDYVEK